MGRRNALGLAAVLLSLLLAPGGLAVEGGSTWDATRVTALAGELHEAVRGLRDEMRARTRDAGTMDAAAWYRLLDELRLLDREARHLHRALEGGAGREETLPTYARIAVLRRDCAAEMRQQLITAPVREGLERARSVVKQMDPYYGFDPARPDHERVLRR